MLTVAKFAKPLEIDRIGLDKILDQAQCISKHIQKWKSLRSRASVVM